MYSVPPKVGCVTTSPWEIDNEIYDAWWQFLIDRYKKRKDYNGIKE